MLTTKLGIGNFWLQPDAAASFLRMVAAAGTRSGLAAAGRTYAEQERLYALYLAGKGNLAAKPGHSLHESGLAVDVTRKSPLQLWMVHGSDPMMVTPTGTTRAAEYGWHRTVPSEAWHFSYNQATDKHLPKPTPAPLAVPTLARMATFNCAGFGHSSLPAKTIDALVGTLLKIDASIYCLTECPEWMRNHIRGACTCPKAAHRRLDGKRWLVYVRGSQAILFDSKKWAKGGSTSGVFGPTSYHGWLTATLTQTTTKARLTVGCYHLPPNSVSTQAYQRDKLRGFLGKLTAGARLTGGDGADDTGWFSGWTDTRTAAKTSPNRAAPTYQHKSITDRIHVRGITVRKYTVVSSGGASDHDAVLAQITIPATSTS